MSKPSVTLDGNRVRIDLMGRTNLSGPEAKAFAEELLKAAEDAADCEARMSEWTVWGLMMMRKGRL